MADVGRFARLDNWQFRAVRQGTPGAFTFILPATHEVPRRLQQPRRRTIGVRIPDHALARALLDELGAPIISTTLIAPESSEPLNAAASIRARFGGAIDLIADSGPCTATPTTVVDLAQSPPVVVRRGLGDPGRLGLP
jgi:tRNA threonylcarbamoyl adenosine modification protein (Sua5/YciO/YrdC/YwlC family)